MYLRGVHAESNIPTLHSFIENNPLGIFTTAIPSSTYPFIQSSHIPWVLDVSESSNDSPGVLRGHIAKQNPQAKAIIESVKSTNPGASGGVQLEDEVLVLFNGPAHHYVTPKFYTETKPATGKVVPTWDYSAVQAYGKATIYFDGGEEATQFLSSQIDALSRHAESSIMGYTGQDGQQGPWTVDDAPDRYIALLQKAIVGIRIDLTRLEGKFKMSQEMGAGDRAGVAQGFQNLGTETGKEMAQCVLEREKIAMKGK
ncbi:hypothetical protein EYZ11_006163 [Aspergillus tanneri]|uniref:Transcriptional regulator n=1 Tax=Aspergillus tanneri TaxID=1220188 RepID=A0A4S3JGR1_9EURO|nr:uncharacterized protein ATNIH1004_003979 [Aspergillus tanneri]KAA8648096.1 hypothetical protein ATNIH1004_003979 [Aspergillus tanneri]THC94365.1 hypothetical protein EYZ11_006163 [Aspergillus tanneri]